MNLLGHNYIASQILKNVSAYTLLGSHIPDLVPFLPSSVFSFTEIHEDHAGLLEFVKNAYPDAIELPISIMCHSVKFGADEYNRQIDEWLFEGNDALKNKIAAKISEISNVSFETAVGPRLHNYLWCGVDLFIIKKNPDQLVDKLSESLSKVDYDMTARILSDYYKKDNAAIRNNLLEFFEPINTLVFRSEVGFAKFWKVFLSPLDEHDNVDVSGCAELFEFIFKSFESDWERILTTVQDKVRNKMAPFLL